MDFENIDTIDDNNFHFWTALTKKQVITILDQKPFFRNRSDRPATTLGMYLTKIRTGQSDERLATKFQISRRTLERKLKTARECLTDDFVPRYLGLNHITREEVVARNLRIPTHIFGGSQLNRQLYLCSTEHIFTFRRVRISFSKEKPTAYTNSATTLVNLRR
ncbi:hypothetical protein HF086_002959 [Spodoptera exigua]|uniref:Uncharacterized protein n=1 Tax=Spodoptera exigua TaxID=7107 RepID=A0A922SRW1_SPOEX|nr:hypothetical protein HF086_002959 [Spodoptera exigua]